MEKKFRVEWFFDIFEYLYLIWSYWRNMSALNVHSVENDMVWFVKPEAVCCVPSQGWENGYLTRDQDIKMSELCFCWEFLRGNIVPGFFVVQNFRERILLIVHDSWLRSFEDFILFMSLRIMPLTNGDMYFWAIGFKTAARNFSQMRIRISRHVPSTGEDYGRWWGYKASGSGQNLNSKYRSSNFD